jgi:hypothetical protein
VPAVHAHVVMVVKHDLSATLILSVCLLEGNEPNRLCGPKTEEALTEG